MTGPMKLQQLGRWFVHLSLAQQFGLASLLILLGNMLGIGWWIGQQIEVRVIHQTATTAALYVDSFIAPHLQNLAHTSDLTADQAQRLSQQMVKTPLGQQIVAFKIWDAEGHILYSTNPALMNQRFPVHARLARAWRGEVVSKISTLHEEENIQERAHWMELLETYSPVRQEGSDTIIAVVEFYQPVKALKQNIRKAQSQGWLMVGVATGIMYLLLAGIVRRGNKTIQCQQEELNQKIAQLTDLLEQNEALHERVRRAATRTAALNERLLRRISAELHDGPAQTLSLALLRLDHVSVHSGSCSGCKTEDGQTTATLDTIQTALQWTLQEMRTIAKGLRLPELSRLPVVDTLTKVVRDHELRTGTKVSFACCDLPIQAPLSIKITLYRVVQEALHNAYRHGKGGDQRVQVTCEAETMQVRISDQGPGFTWSPLELEEDRLGLAGMRERVESLGGQFHIETAPGEGTTVAARLSLNAEDDKYE